MMTRRTHSPPSYDASTDRRDDDRQPDAIKGLWFRRLKPTEVAASLALLFALLGAVGWRFYSVADLAERVSKIEAQQKLDSYVLCVIARSVAPESTPPDCAPIIQSRRVTP
jgi:hypothetical protein